MHVYFVYILYCISCSSVTKVVSGDLCIKYVFCMAVLLNGYLFCCLASVKELA